MSEGGLFAGLMAVIAACVLGVVGLCVHVGKWNDAKIIQLIEAGVPAPEAVCVIRGCDTKTWLLIRPVTVK